MKIHLAVLGAVVCSLLFAVTPAAAETNNTSAKHSPVPQAWPAEVLSGKIISVDPSSGRMVVKTSDGVPFDFDINSHTRIDANNKRATLKALQSDLNKGVSVKFVPESKGDIAQSIQING